jgi:hypothetical protein
MQIDMFPEQSVTFKITNGDDDAVGLFYSVLAKCRKEVLRTGLKNMFNSEERVFIKEFTDKFQSGDEVKY